MLKGTIICPCAQLFGFTTEEDEVLCPTCGRIFTSAEHADPVIEEPILLKDGASLIEGGDTIAAGI